VRSRAARARLALVALSPHRGVMVRATCPGSDGAARSPAADREPDRDGRRPDPPPSGSLRTRQRHRRNEGVRSRQRPRRCGRRTLQDPGTTH
jgi:hypothetical protein